MSTTSVINKHKPIIVGSLIIFYFIIIIILGTVGYNFILPLYQNNYSNTNPSTYVNPSPNLGPNLNLSPNLNPNQNPNLNSGSGINSSPGPNPNISPSENPTLNSKPNTQIGLCYAYDKTKYQGDQCMDFEKLLIQDLQKIKAAGYNDVKTYWGYFGGEYGCLCDPIKGGMFAKIASLVGINIYLGINPDSYPYDSWGFDVRNCILNSLKMYNGTVKGIIIGNENVNGIGNIEMSKKIISVYNDLKSQGIRLPMGTAQQNGYWLSVKNPQSAYKMLMDTLDFCGANIYPAPFPGTENKEMNKKTLIDQFNEMKQTLGEKLWITETGIPGSGNTLDQKFTKAIQADLLYQINEWHKLNPRTQIFLFEAFNEPSKPDNIKDFNVEKHFGIL